MRAADRHILFLQGPHGPFLRQLGTALGRAGCAVTRVLLNGGDAAEWRGMPGGVPYRGAADGLRAFLDALIDARGITDMVLYGDDRPCHRLAVQAARAAGLRLHFLEEGYLRPHWITYERDGVNGSSPLLDISDAALGAVDPDAPLRAAPDQWGAMWAHLWHGLAYHARVWATARAWPAHRPHRPASPRTDLGHAARALALQPVRLVRRRLRERALRATGAPYHLVLLQLGHDASIRAHSRFDGMRPFMQEVAAAFAAGAPAHHHLVFKAHPFEDDREGLMAHAAALARRHHLAGRVHYMEGERLASLLDRAESAVTVNSTAAQQALWRNLPVRIFGRAVFDRARLVSDQPLPAFFAAPRRPDHAAYLTFRRALLSTSQVPGGFYTRRGRRALIQRLPDAILGAQGPYAALTGPGRAPAATLVALKAHPARH